MFACSASLRGPFFIPIAYGGYAVVAIGSLVFVRETRNVLLEDLDR